MKPAPPPSHHHRRQGGGGGSNPPSLVGSSDAEAGGRPGAAAAAAAAGPGQGSNCQKNDAGSQARAGSGNYYPPGGSGDPSDGVGCSPAHSFPQSPTQFPCGEGSSDAASPSPKNSGGNKRKKNSGPSTPLSPSKRRHHNVRPSVTAGASKSPASPPNDGRRHSAGSAASTSAAPNETPCVSAGSEASSAASGKTPTATSSAASSETSSTASGRSSRQSRSKSTKHSSGLVSQTSAEDYVGLWDATDNPHVVNPETLQSIQECIEAAEAESGFVSHLQGILATIPLSVLKTEGALQMIFGCFDPAILELVLSCDFEAPGLSARTLSKTKRKIKLDRKEVHGTYWRAHASSIGEHRKAFQWMAENHADPEVRQFATKRLKRSEGKPGNDPSCVSYAGTCWGKPIGERLDEPRHGLEAKVFKALGGPTHEMCVACAVPKCEVQSKILEAAFAVFIQGATILTLRSWGCDDSYRLMTSDGSELNVANCGEVYWDQLSFGGINKVIDWLVENSGKTDLTPWSDPVTPIYVHGWMSAKGGSILAYFASKPEFAGVTSLDQAKIRGLLSYLGMKGATAKAEHNALAKALKDVDNNVDRLPAKWQAEFHRILKKFRDEEHFWVCMKNHQRPLQERVDAGEELNPVEKKTLATSQKDAERKKNAWSKKSEEEKKAFREKDTERKRKQRQSGSEEEKKAFREKDAERRKKQRQSGSKEEKAARRAKDAQRKKNAWSKMSEEAKAAKAAARKAKDAERYRKKKESMSDADKAANRAKAAERMKASRKRKKEEGKKATSAKKT